MSQPGHETSPATTDPVAASLVRALVARGTVADLDHAAVLAADVPATRKPQGWLADAVGPYHADQAAAAAWSGRLRSAALAALSALGSDANSPAWQPFTAKRARPDDTLNTLPADHWGDRGYSAAHIRCLQGILADADQALRGPTAVRDQGDRYAWALVHAVVTRRLTQVGRLACAAITARRGAVVAAASDLVAVAVVWVAIVTQAVAWWSRYVEQHEPRSAPPTDAPSRSPRSPRAPALPVWAGLCR